MPKSAAKKRAYSHIFNKGSKGGSIFKEDSDYKTFLSFLSEYLSAPLDVESKKKVFTVNGRTFRGVPHQPKNYKNKVELVAYSLSPNKFHLVLSENEKGAQERFLRSLATRYSMYFNKKYKRAGSLFDGPYKSSQTEDLPLLLLLTQHLHQNGEHSSLNDYLETTDNSWVKPKSVLEIFEQSKKNDSLGIDSYNSFVENYKLNSSEKEMLEKILLERILDTNSEAKSASLEESEEELEGSEKTKKRILTSNFSEQSEENIPGLTWIISTTLIFILLLGIGLRNISVSANETLIKPEVSGVSTKSTSEKSPIADEDEAEIKRIILIVTGDATSVVNIRKDASIGSPRVATAKTGDQFEVVSATSKWYEVKLEGGKTGFVSATYVLEKEIIRN